MGFATIWNLIKKIFNGFSFILDVQSDVPYAHPQRTETLHMHNVSKGILPQFRSQEGKYF